MAVERQPGKGLWGGDLLVFDELVSTNQWTLDNIAGCKRGDVIRAIRQTGGRGRFGRSWLSDPRASLAFSVVIDPCKNAEIAFFYGAIAALTVRSYAAAAGARDVSVKWPNDVLAHGHKFCGILLEQCADGRLALGVGINVNQTVEDLQSAGLETMATSLRISAGRELDLKNVFGTLLREMEIRLGRLAPAECPKLVSEWNAHDCLVGHLVKVTSGETVVRGLSRGMTPTGQLAVVDEEGEQHFFWAGNVTLAPPESP